jgi:hypothetical protein
LGHKALHRHRLIPEVKVGHQLIAARSGVQTETDVSAIGLEHRQLGLEGLTPVAAHLQGSFGWGMAQVAERSEQGLAIAKLGFDRAEVRHRWEQRRV